MNLIDYLEDFLNYVINYYAASTSFPGHLTTGKSRARKGIVYTFSSRILRTPFSEQLSTTESIWFSWCFSFHICREEV